MSLRKRKAVYYFFALIFVVWGTYLVISTQGIVFDWEDLKFVKTGGIYLKFNPSDAEVFMNGEKTDKSTGILNRGIILDKLLPRTYHMSIRKNSYVAWEKDLSVDEGVFTAASVIKLWPETPEKYHIATSTAKDITVIDGGIIEKTDEKKLVSFGKELKGNSIFASREDSDWIITRDEGDALFFMNAKDPKTSINIRNIFASLRKRQIPETMDEGDIQHAIIHPFSDEKIILATEQSMYVLDLKKIIIEEMTFGTSTITTLIERGNEIFGISNSGEVRGINLVLLKSFSFNIGTSSVVTNTMSLSDSGTRFLFTDQKSQLFLFDRNLNTTKKLAQDIQSFVISPDGTKAVWIDTKKKVSVYYIDQDEGDTRFQKGTVSFLAISPSEINKKTRLFWLAEFPTHIFLETSGKVLVSEIDPRGDTPNTAPLTESLSNVFITRENIYITEESLDEKTFSFSRLKF